MSSANRGRGCQEIHPSRSPFFQTTANFDIGIDISKNVEWEAPFVKKTGIVEKSGDAAKMEKNFGFLYAKSSDVIGSKVKFERSALSEAFCHIETSKAQIVKSRAMRHSSLEEVDQDQGQEEDKTDITEAKHQLQDHFDNFQHVTRVQDPRFTTTSNEYGKNKPTAETFVMERKNRPQGFSASFNNVKPKNTSLNTSITKSHVHPSLDPQFA